MSLWIWRLTTLWERMPKSTLRSLAVTAKWALARARPTSSQTLDIWETTFSFPLVNILYLFGWGVISSIKVIGEAILVASRTKVTRVIGVPFSTTRTTFFPRLERGSFFLAFILAYISWLNLVVISVWPKVHVLKKNKEKKKRKERKGNKREKKERMKRTQKLNLIFSSISMACKTKGEGLGPR